MVQGRTALERDFAGDPRALAGQPMGDAQDEALVKIRVDLPNHWATGGESIWALPLGDDQFEIRNTPFHAYGLNFLDVVLATSDAADRKPEVRSIVRRSGHRTLRVFFAKETSLHERAGWLARLSPLGVTYEGMNERFFALDVPPHGDYAAVRSSLDEWEKNGILCYETCEARVTGSFDDRVETTDLGGDRTA